MTNKICLIVPGLLPVPATQGGAIETLMTSLVRENEASHAIEAVVVSPYDEQAYRDSSQYRHTRFVFVKAGRGG